MTSPTQRSLALLRKQGYQVGIVEKWNPHIKIRQDLWGFADLIACFPGPGGHIILVQCFGSDFAVHRRKILATPAAKVWLDSGGGILLQGWTRRPPLKGKKRIRVELREEWLTTGMFQPPESGEQHE